MKKINVKASVCGNGTDCKTHEDVLPSLSTKTKVVSITPTAKITTRKAA
jgi:hypothetical protein